jgi:hypothetical protein
MIYNFWLRLDPSAASEMESTYAIQTDEFEEPDEVPVATQATNFPLLNVMKPKTIEIIKRRWLQDKDRAVTMGLSPVPIWNLYSDVRDDLSSMVVVREDFQLLEEHYPGDIECVGAWQWDGQPIGGVGSPWFLSPIEIKNIGNVILRAGQAPRQFV